jgi:predicted transcriptional regulator
MEEILTIRVPKGTRRRLEAAARARRLTLSQYVREALTTEQFLDAFEAARADLVPQARGLGIYADEDVFKLIS